MKKLMTILVVFALCGVAMAQNGSSSAKKQIPLNDGRHDYVTYVSQNEQGSSALDYVASSSKTPWGEHDGHKVAHVYFKTFSQDELTAWNQANDKNMTKVVVQFAGTQIEWGNNKPANDWIQDYGIYLCDSKGARTSEFLSVTTGNTGKENYYELDPNQNFGVYYKDVNGQIVTTTRNWVGNYDTGNHPTIAGANEITVYDDEHPDGYDTYTYKKFMCVFETSEPYWNEEYIHWEFMLQTTLDNPYYNVNPDDFTGNGETFAGETSGQPLPGTLATLLIGSLCAAGLRKKNQK